MHPDISKRCIFLAIFFVVSEYTYPTYHRTWNPTMLSHFSITSSWSPAVHIHKMDSKIGQKWLIFWMFLTTVVRLPCHLLWTRIIMEMLLSVHLKHWLSFRRKRIEISSLLIAAANGDRRNCDIRGYKKSHNPWKYAQDYGNSMPFFFILLYLNCCLKLLLQGHRKVIVFTLLYTFIFVNNEVKDVIEWKFHLGGSSWP